MKKAPKFTEAQKAPEDENCRLKKIVAVPTLDREKLQVRTVNQTIRGIVAGPQA